VNYVCERSQKLVIVEVQWNDMGETEELRSELPENKAGCASNLHYTHTQRVNCTPGTQSVLSITHTQRRPTYPQQ